MAQTARTRRRREARRRPPPGLATTPGAMQQGGVGQECLPAMRQSRRAPWPTQPGKGDAAWLEGGLQARYIRVPGGRTFAQRLVHGLPHLEACSGRGGGAQLGAASRQAQGWHQSVNVAMGWPRMRGTEGQRPSCLTPNPVPTPAPIVPVWLEGERLGFVVVAGGLCVYEGDGEGAGCGVCVHWSFS